MSLYLQLIVSPGYLAKGFACMTITWESGVRRPHQHQIGDGRGSEWLLRKTGVGGGRAGPGALSQTTTPGVLQSGPKKLQKENGTPAHNPPPCSSVTWTQSPFSSITENFIFS